MNSTSTLVFFVNGKKVEDNYIDPEWTLLYYLRNKLRLCGTKLGCGEGGCGACTVMISKIDRKTQKITHLSVNACLAPVASMHGLSVTTVEGIGSTKSRLHPVQERIAAGHGTQCGFCTPGIVMSMYALLRSQPKPSMDDLEVAFQGNLCRCTGYRPILEAYSTFCSANTECCRRNGKINGECKANQLSNVDDETNELRNSNGYKPYDPTQELIFPPELMVYDKYDKEYLIIHGPRATWYRPTTLQQLVELKNKYPSAKIVNGNTEIGIEMKFKNQIYKELISSNQINEMLQIEVDDQYLKVGSAVTISQFGEEINRLLNTMQSYKTRILKAIAEMLKLFAGMQIRNVGTVGGNIMNGSPISDLNPIFMAANCKLRLINQDGTRDIQMDDKFWSGYKKSLVKNDEILTAIYIPFTKQEQYFKAYKQSKRKDDDIAIVNAAYFVELNDMKILNMRMAYGGMAPTTVMAVKTCASIINLNWRELILDQVFQSLSEELPLSFDAPGGMIEYRKALTLSFFFKFYTSICETLNAKGLNINVSPEEKSANKKFQKWPLRSSQFYFVDRQNEQINETVGQPIVHQSAFKHATGEAVYCDDMPTLENELHLCLLRSKRTYAKLISIDVDKAMAVGGVIGFFSAKDLPANRNRCGAIVDDEEIFASEIVYCEGQIIGALAATSAEIAYRAIDLIKVTYEDLSPTIITIEDAIKHNSYFPLSPFTIECGNIEEAFIVADKIVEGELHIGGQEHFYLETQNSLAIPSSEDQSILIYSSCQHPTDLQRQVGNMLGLSYNQIISKVKRIGGGFGGKESRSVVLALPTALVAHKLKRPVRLSLERNEDIIISGHRHPFYSKYKAGFTKEGKIIAINIDLYCNAGCTMDLSDAVMERAMQHITNTMHIPNLLCNGYVCKTNLPSNTAFRGFGTPQAMLIAETIIYQVAETLNMDVNKVHEINFCKNGDVTHYKQKIFDCNIEACWKECLIQSEYEKRKISVEKFNSENRYMKRGISVVPTMFGAGYSIPFLNQAGALVLVYTDGSVLLSHGGTEMGQGLHTKMIQVASQVLDVPIKDIEIAVTTTDKVPNTSATAASTSSDLNGMAVKNACEEIKKRLQPIINKNPKGTWKDWIQQAYLEQISLSAFGFYRIPNIGPNDENETVTLFNYYTYGVACSEVEIDCLTGDHQVIRTDIVMDIGQSLNPAIDIGQIEGAFMQGYGLYTIEELNYSRQGIIYSTGPGTYKIPGFSNIPMEFNVSLLKGSQNPRAVYSSKAVGEPPLFLASSVFFAIREAIKAARQNVDKGGKSFILNSPATAAKIRMACEDQLTDRVKSTTKDNKATGEPWCISI